MIAAIITDDGSISLVVNNQDYSVTTTHPNYTQILTCIQDNDEQALLQVLAIKTSIIKSLIKSNISIHDNQVYYYGEILNSELASRILEFLDHKLPIKSLQIFLSNLMANPSKRAVDALYEFLAHKNLPITEDGHFLAYKGVDHDYLDQWTHTIDNSIGSKPEIRRNLVDDNIERQCSYGFHVGTINYAKSMIHSSGHVVIVKINPEDVVSIPSDGTAQKLRVCKYEVVGKYQKTLTQPCYEVKTNQVKEINQKIPGVTFDKKNKKWRARSYFNNHVYHIGYFSSQDKAKLAKFQWEMKNDH